VLTSYELDVVDAWKEIHNCQCRQSGDTTQREALAREILEKSQRRRRLTVSLFENSNRHRSGQVAADSSPRTPSPAG